MKTGARAAVLALCSMLACDGNAATTSYTTIGQIKAGSVGVLVYATAGTTWSDELSCGGSTTTSYVFIDAAAPDFDNIYPLLLLAASKNWQVSFWYESCSGGVWGGPFVSAKALYARPAVQ